MQIRCTLFFFFFLSLQSTLLRLEVCIGTDAFSACLVTVVLVTVRFHILLFLQWGKVHIKGKLV